MAGTSLPETVDVDERSLVDLGTHSLYLLDADRRDLSQILDEIGTGRFQPYPLSAPNFASTPDDVWLLFRLRNHTSRPLYLNVGSPFIDHIEVHHLTDDLRGAQRTHIAGDDYAFRKREIQVTTFYFKLDLPSDSTGVYLLRARSLQPLFFTLQTGTLDVFMEQNHKLDLAQGLYFGIMILIGVYNLFLYFGTRDRAYLFYVAYLTCITIFMSLISMVVFEWVWPDFPILNKFAVASSSLTIITSVIFTQVFLETRSRLPRLHKLSYAFLAIGLVDLILVFTPLKIEALQLAQVGILLLSIFLAVVGIVSYREGFTPARFYLLAWGVLLLALIGMILESLNVIPVMPYINAGQIGSALEAMLLSFALADRINMYKREREEAQLLAIEEHRKRVDLVTHQNEVLEERVTERTAELQETLKLVEQERQVSEDLLLNILPAEIAEELKTTGRSSARLYQNVTVLFTDFVNFSVVSEAMSPDDLVQELNRNISAFDAIIERYGLEKIKTIGDAYLAVAGLPTGDPDHALHATQAALDMAAWQKDPANKTMFEMRIGLNSGPVVAGIVGVKKYAYDVWGDTVNTAARMEQTCEPGRVNVSCYTHDLIRPQFRCHHRGKVDVKNLGEIDMFYVDRPR